MPKRFPPFAAIRAFEAAARHCSLRLASQELNLTVSGVSHQIKSLEQFLGVSLFNRANNTLALTATGEAYMRALGNALDIISSATVRAESTRNTTSISINIFPSLAALWIIPRLHTFYENAADIDVNFITSIEPLSFRSGLMDIAIRYQELSSIPAQSSLLFEEQIYPVCTREYAGQTGLLEENNDYKNVTIIRCNTCPTEWDVWFQAMHTVSNKSCRILRVDNRALALQAAQSGIGVAMGRTPYALESLESAKLVRITSKALATGNGYVQSLSDSALRNPAVKKFTTWLAAQARHIDE